MSRRTGGWRSSFVDSRPEFSSINREHFETGFLGCADISRCSPNFFTENGEVCSRRSRTRPVSLIISNNEGRGGLSLGYFREPLPLCGTFIA